jgi:glycosyltransferase involved in cell wall biosynthesis
LAETLVRFGVPEARVEHVPNFLEPKAPQPAGPGEGWLYAGRLTEEKGIRIALRAAADLPQHRFTVCGTGALEAELRATYQRAQHIEFKGHLPRGELEAHIGRARVVVVPSLWYENFPYAVLEAQALGRAVVASRVGGIPEQIEDGVDGRLVPPGDADALRQAVVPLLDRPDIAAALGRAGRSRVTKDLAPAHHLQRVVGIYDNARLSHGAAAGYVRPP